LGPNGAGKTTTIKILLGLTRPDTGTGRILGFDIKRDQMQILERTAFASETKVLYSWMNAQELIYFTRGFYPTWSDAQAQVLARRLQIPLTDPWGILSLGNRTKVSFLLALAQGAPLVILDEPTTGLDPLAQDVVVDILKEFKKDESRTLFFSSHQLSDVEQVADCIGIINEGKLLLEAEMSSIRNEFRIVEVSHDFVSEPKSPYLLASWALGPVKRYLVSQRAEEFVRDLRAGGAEALNILPVTLRELFRALLTKEASCTRGSAGESRGSVSAYY
jgi:ABC-2 type transport system ATP-binding protein